MDFANMDHENVKDYYGQVLKSNDDLQTSACCIAESVPDHLKPILSKVHPEVSSKFYGCGSPIPSSLEGCTVLDLGCGTGQDVFVLSKLVGEKGRVIGVDMTNEQLDVAKKHQKYHAEQFGYRESNVMFKKGFIEDLAALDITDNSVDVVISNCVINLSPAKEKVFSEIFRVLKPGGELYFSDVFSSSRIPLELRKDPVLLGECLSGAMYKEDFRRSLEKIGCADVRSVSSKPLEINDPNIFKKIGMIHFESVTIRAFKLDLEDRCENFGHVATYKGNIGETPHGFLLDDHHYFQTGLPMPVCGNTAKMLSESRLKDHFEVRGNFETHYGLFDCAPQSVSPTTATISTEPNSCC